MWPKNKMPRVGPLGHGFIVRCIYSIPWDLNLIGIFRQERVTDETLPRSRPRPVDFDAVPMKPIEHNECRRYGTLGVQCASYCCEMILPST